MGMMLLGLLATEVLPMVGQLSDLPPLPYRVMYYLHAAYLWRTQPGRRSTRPWPSAQVRAIQMRHPRFPGLPLRALLPAVLQRVRHIRHHRLHFRERGRHLPWVAALLPHATTRLVHGDHGPVTPKPR